MIRRATFSLAGVLILLLAAAELRAQQPGGGWINVTGEAGTFSEANWMFGAENRRPPASARLYLRPSLSLWGKYTVTGSFIVSTENRGFQGDVRQSLNQYSVSPSWEWGKATLGDFSDSYSPLTVNGVQVRGAGVELQRGSMRFNAFGGRSQQAAEGGAIRGRYARRLAGGRFSVGDTERSSLALTVVSARDDVGSLGAPSDTIFLQPMPDSTFAEDTLQVGVENQFSVTPQENLVVGLAGTLAFFEDGLQLKGEIAGSGHTRDLRSDVIRNEEILDRIPGIAQSFFTPRASSSADHAHTLEARVRPVAPLTTTLTYRYLGPGYVSLGAASMMSDRREFQLRTGFRLRRFQANVDLGRQHDNLAGQKLFTTMRHRAAASTSLRVTPQWTTTARAQRASLGNGAPDPERWIDYTSWQAGLRNSFSFRRGGLVRSISLDYSHRSTGDANPLRTATASQSHGATASLQAAPGRTLSVTPTLGFVHSRFGEAEWTTRSTYGIGAQHSAWEGRWATSLNLGRSQFQQTTALQANVTSRLQVAPRDAVVFGLKAGGYDNSLDPGLSFNELNVSIRWAHRF
jgi:hypothetical protein